MLLQLLRFLLFQAVIVTGFASDSRGKRSTTCTRRMASEDSEVGGWKQSSESDEDELLAKALSVWPLDRYNVDLLNEVRHKNYVNPKPLEIYDLVVLGSGAGGLVSSRQAARRGARVAMVSSELAGGDCLNAGCVPSKALLRCARMIREVKEAAVRDNQFGVRFKNNGVSIDKVEIDVDFPQIMKRMRKLRAKISPVDGHARGDSVGVATYQGFGVFTSPSTIEVVEYGKQLGDESNPKLNFRKAVIATGGRPRVLDIPGLKDSPYTTNLNLFNLQELPKRMVVLGAGVVALEMAQAFAAFGSEVTVLERSRLLSKGDEEAATLLRSTLVSQGVKFISGVVEKVETLREPSDSDLPLMSVSLSSKEQSEIKQIKCECLLVALGREANVKDIGLEDANVESSSNGVLVNDFAQSRSNPNVYAVGDCVANVPRLTHVAGEMAKVVVQNALFEGQWKLTTFVIPAVMYTEPEYAVINRLNVDNDGNVVTKENEEEVDVYKADLEGNDRAILDSSDKIHEGFVKILTKKGTGTIVGCTVVSSRAGEIVNEISLAMKHGIDLEGLGRNIHSYPTLGEAVMGCGLQYINSKWKTMS